MIYTVTTYSNLNGKALEVENFEHPDDAEYSAEMINDYGYESEVFAVVTYS